MASRQKFTNEIIQSQEVNSCLMISSCIILNYYTGLTADKLFEYFLEKNDFLYSQFNINKDLVKNLPLEVRYEKLYTDLVNASHGEVQFSNSFLIDTFKNLAEEYNISMEWCDIKLKSKEIKDELIENESFLSAALHGRFGCHVMPIGYDTEFYTTHQGRYFLLGEDFFSIKNLINANDIGDGILFKRK